MNSRSSFTLVELITAITLLAVIFGFFSLILIQGHNQFAYAVQLHQAVSLADVYMNEVLSTGRWDEQSNGFDQRTGSIPLSIASIGPEENKRIDYDDCDDYDGFLAEGEHTYKNGQPVQGHNSSYTVSIQVSFVRYGSTVLTNTPTNSKQITVFVSWKNNHQTHLSTILTNF